MIKIEYPAEKPLIKRESERETVFCIVRKRWVRLTPEEWVRQNFLLYLTAVLGWPASLIAVEKQVLVGGRKRRFDAVVYRNSEPFLLLECKEMTVALTQKTLLQILRYNMEMQAEYIVVTNGGECACFRRSDGKFLPTEALPVFGK